MSDTNVIHSFPIWKTSWTLDVDLYVNGFNQNPDHFLVSWTKEVQSFTTEYTNAFGLLMRIYFVDNGAC